jgi:hypothetical protein
MNAAKKYGAMLDGKQITSLGQLRQAQRNQHYAMQAFQITLATTVAPALTRIVMMVDEMIARFNTMPGPLKELAFRFGLVATLLGPLVTLLGSTARAGVWLSKVFIALRTTQTAAAASTATLAASQTAAGTAGVAAATATSAAWKRAIPILAALTAGYMVFKGLQEKVTGKGLSAPFSEQLVMKLKKEGWTDLGIGRDYVEGTDPRGKQRRLRIGAAHGPITTQLEALNMSGLGRGGSDRIVIENRIPVIIDGREVFEVVDKQVRRKNARK